MPMTPYGYQGLSEGNLGSAESNIGGASVAGQNLRNMGTGLTARWTDMFMPVYSQLINNANFRPNLVDEAGVDANLAGQNAIRGQQINLERMGINPASPRYAALSQQWANALAASVAGAKTRASRTEQDSVYNRLATALGYGNSMLGMGSNMMQAGGNLGLGAGAGFAGQAERYGSLASAAVGSGAYGGDAGQGGTFQDQLDGMLDSYSGGEGM